MWLKVQIILCTYCLEEREMEALSWLGRVGWLGPERWAVKGMGGQGGGVEVRV